MSILKNLALKVAPLRRLHDSRDNLKRALDREICESARLQAEASSLQRQLQEAEGAYKSPFFHYAANFDAMATMRRYAVQDLKPDPGFVTNWLGVRIDPKFFPAILDDRVGHCPWSPWVN